MKAKNDSAGIRTRVGRKMPRVASAHDTPTLLNLYIVCKLKFDSLIVVELRKLWRKDSDLGCVSAHV